MATMPVVELCRVGLDLGVYFERHLACDWGDVDEDTSKANQDGVEWKVEGPIRSSYTATVQGVERKIWIVTAADRSRTVVMLPSDITV